MKSVSKIKLYIVTGASGLVGTNLIRKLDKENCQIIALINNTPLHYHSHKITEIKASVSNLKDLEKVFDQNNENTVCIHCAGIITIKSKNDNTVYETNVKGTKNIIKMCLKYNVRLIYVSSVHATKELPHGTVIKENNNFDANILTGIYAKTKAEASKLVLEAKGLKAVIVQPSAIIGPYDYNKGNFTTLIENYINGKLPAIILGGYDFVDVRDVVEGIIGAINFGRNKECYFLNNKYYSVPELINTLSKVTGKKTVKLIMPTWFIKLLAPIFELVSDIKKERPLFTPYSIYVLHTNANFSHKKASKELNYNPRNLEETLKDTVDWINEQKRLDD